jgi:hypothetical protein
MSNLTKTNGNGNGNGRKLYILLVTLLCTLSIQATTMLVDTDWSKSCPGNDFCFEHPSELVDLKRPIIDSNTGEYRSKKMQLVYDMGWYSSQFDELENPIIKTITIDGKQGEILTTDNVMALRIPSVEGKVRFSMLITFTEELNSKDGYRILTSVKFLSIQK